MTVVFTLKNSVGCVVCSAERESGETYTATRDSLVSILEKEDWLLDDGDTIEITVK